MQTRKGEHKTTAPSHLRTTAKDEYTVGITPLDPSASVPAPHLERNKGSGKLEMILKRQGQLLLGIQKQRGQKLHTGFEPVTPTGSQAHAQEMPGSSPGRHLHARHRHTTTVPAALQVQLRMDGVLASANPRSLIHFRALTKTLQQCIHQGWGQIQLSGV